MDDDASIPSIEQCIQLGLPIKQRCFDGQTLFHRNWEQLTFIQCSFRGCQWVSCKLDKSAFIECDFTESRWQSVSLLHANFVRCQLPAALFCPGHYQGISFSESDLQLSCWADCHWQRCVWLKCKLQGSQWLQATVVQSCMVECELRAADFRNTVLQQSALLDVPWRSMTLQGMRASQSVLKQGDWQGCDLRGISFQQCNLQQGNFSQVNATGADLTEANLSFSKWQHAVCKGITATRSLWLNTQLHEVDFTEACMESAIFQKADLVGCRFFRGQLQKTCWRFAQVNTVDFSGADCSYADFSHGLLTNNQWLGTALNHSQIHNTEGDLSAWKNAAYVQGTNDQLLNAEQPILHWEQS
ncbi:pentapeptide repeat-containing protein [Zooshikella sp. RANM57]|uniref:pentapeptide repeat-containing protein n=1 Tax=Zooshikella sp. RANM57 TaxID=3425863 RepID=UPI003D6E8C81